MKAELSMKMIKRLNCFLSIDRFVLSEFDQKHFVKTKALQSISVNRQENKL